MTALVLVDPDRATSTRIADRVLVDTARMSSAFGDDTVVVSVDDGARTGVWIARLSGG